ncbi:unnamed protein product [Thlaspi arvense]|uniref:Pentatricopeptide repeat-containing protein n=1 Tax=Thlaspi arvense TaxID=13288 RepID=A0AAU9T715_THLAR|nr:unnamed protein product [Thlaspi arvense]
MFRMISFLSQSTRNACSSLSLSARANRYVGRSLSVSPFGHDSVSSSSTGGGIACRYLSVQGYGLPESGIGNREWNSEQHFVLLLEKKIRDVEGQAVKYVVNPSRIHASIFKCGITSDQVLCKQLRLYASSGHLSATEQFFKECYDANTAGLGVWNAYICGMATHGSGREALRAFENMPNTLLKTRATYWNALVACSHLGETGYAHYLLGKVFKLLAMEPTIELLGTYVDSLARNWELEKAVLVVKSMVYKLNKKIIVSILGRYENHAKPIVFAQEFVRYLEEEGVTYYIPKATYRKLVDDERRRVGDLVLSDMLEDIGDPAHVEDDL